MLLEEKRHRWMPKSYQISMYRVLDAACAGAKDYRGFHILVFENTTPDDGWIYLDGRHIVRRELISFLQFEQTPEFYQSWWPPSNIKRLGRDI